MKHSERNTNRLSTLTARIGGGFGMLLVLGLLLAAPASAALEQVDNFAESGEANQLENISGLAVNTTGAGGVPPGTVYAVAGGENRHHLLRYTAKGEFRAAWGWNVSVAPGAGFQRCGPDGEPAHPVCSTGATATSGEGIGQFSRPRGVAVDQTTGYVYVLNSPGTARLHNIIQVFSADGSQLIDAFGDAAPGGETLDQSPEKIHNTYWTSGIAVNDAGTVYVADSANAGEERVMLFKPQSPGDYENYVYSGRGNDISTSGHLGLDDAGNLYSATGEEILMFTPGEPDAPSCEFEADNGLISMAVNPVNGKVVYWTFKKPKVIRQLGACNAQGEFEEEGEFTLSPQLGTSGGIGALGFNPTLAWEPSRPAGILYGAQTVNGLGYIFASAEVRSPVVESESAGSVTATTATLGARINSKGSNTSFVFQYIDQAAYEANEPAERFAGAIEAPLGGGSLPAAQEGLSAAASLLGLAPDTTYHYRVIASSHCEPDNEEAECVDTGEDQTFRTYPLQAPGLADDRAWELVSPAQKYGGEVFPLESNVGSGARCGGEGGCKPGFNTPAFPRQSSPGGDAVAYEGFPFSGTEGASVFNEYVSKRTASGWQTKILAPALLNGAYEAFDAELTRGILSQTAPSLTSGAPSDFSNLYTQPTASPSSLSPLLGFAPPNRVPGEASPNRLIVQYAGASDDLSHIFFRANDALSGETPFAPEAVAGDAIQYNLYESVDGQLRLVNVMPGNTETEPGASVDFGYRAGSDRPHAISADGSRVFWSDEAGQVYVRIDGESTVEVPDPGKYLTASDDGSKVLLSNGHIYDLESEAITDLTEGQGGFLGIAGQSEDLSHIYFVHTAVLSGEEENAQGDKAQAGKPNLYAWHEGESTFVATLLPGDDIPNFIGTWNAPPVRRTAQASPGGRWLAFLTLASVTGYDNVGPTCAKGGGNKYVNGICREAFLYDSATGELHCASCSPAGVRPLGPTLLPVVSGGGYQQPRYLTDAGRLYFDTQEALSPFDTNRAVEGMSSNIPPEPVGAGEAGAEDVYQYEPEGIGGCEREGGCASLISAGRESRDSNFIAIDETGKSVFFVTRDQLALKDRDELVDLYVAREGGGIASETETARGECQGEACQPQVSPPTDPTPSSSSFSGAGNVVQKKPVTRKPRKNRHKHKAKKRHGHKRAAKHNRGGHR